MREVEKLFCLTITGTAVSLFCVNLWSVYFFLPKRFTNKTNGGRRLNLLHDFGFGLLSVWGSLWVKCLRDGMFYFHYKRHNIAQKPSFSVSKKGRKSNAKCNTNCNRPSFLSWVELKSGISPVHDVSIHVLKNNQMLPLSTEKNFETFGSNGFKSISVWGKV